MKFWFTIMVVGVNVLVGCSLVGISQAKEKTKNSACVHDDKTFRCVRYVRNYDCDTVTINIDNVHPLIGKEISVRTIGIDCAEIRGKNQCEKDAAVRARDFVTKRLSRAKRIDLVAVGKDKYFRLLSNIVYDGKSLGDELLLAGLAVKYDGGTKKIVDWCKLLPKMTH